jgi:hypothetical protein
MAKYYLRFKTVSNFLALDKSASEEAIVLDYS